jgi:hypothetical protein
MRLGRSRVLPARTAVAGWPVLAVPKARKGASGRPRAETGCQNRFARTGTGNSPSGAAYRFGGQFSAAQPIEERSRSRSIGPDFGRRGLQKSEPGEQRCLHLGNRLGPQAVFSASRRELCSPPSRACRSSGCSGTPLNQGSPVTRARSIAPRRLLPPLHLWAERLVART